ncbi:ubiquitin-associated (UBA)/TS-N domain-containing protein isoform X2 [Wolffia australiana]
MEPEKEMAKLRVAGIWCGVLEGVALDSWTVAMLKEEISKRSHGRHRPECINLISAGKVLRDETRSLLQLGLKNNSKILASAAAPAEERSRIVEEEASEAERVQRLNRIRAAAEKLSRTSADESLPTEDYRIELENQAGEKVMFGSETDQRAVMMGLMLHANGKKLVKKKTYRDALDVLMMAEEAFSLCDPKVIQMVDNFPILELDIVWCYFMLRDISLLSLAGARLTKARKGFELSHGKNSTRMLRLQSGRHVEAAIYVRLELLEGVVAFHSGKFEQAELSLISAHERYSKLQVSDETLSLLMGMGYREQSAKRALRLSSQDVPTAVDLLEEERQRKIRRRQENLQRKAEIREQRKYGLTPQKKHVDLEQLSVLESIGFERNLAAEALRKNENHTQKALDDLTNPETNSQLQLSIERRRHRISTRTGNEDQSAESSRERTGSDASSSSRAVTPVVEFMAGDEERDEEMEKEIAGQITGDSLMDYDIEVQEEGEAIAEYLAMIKSSSSGSSGTWTMDETGLRSSRPMSGYFNFVQNVPSRNSSIEEKNRLRPNFASFVPPEKNCPILCPG